MRERDCVNDIVRDAQFLDYQCSFSSYFVFFPQQHPRHFSINFISTEILFIYKNGESEWLGYTVFKLENIYYLCVMAEETNTLLWRLLKC